jgi:drug/metabolite transporter (DMT)-like permease
VLISKYSSLSLLSIFTKIFALFAAVLFSSSNMFIKMGFLLNAADHLVINFTVSGVMMCIIMKVKNINMNGPLIMGLPICLLVLRSILGVFGLFFLYFSLLLIPPSDVSACGHSSIIFTAILSKIILKEKLSISHMFALIFTLIGVFLIAKPTFLFSKYETQTNESEFSDKNFNNKTDNKSNVPNMNESFKLILGISMVFLAAIFFGTCSIVVKKLCNKNVHWSIVTIFPSYFGLPISLALSFIFYFTEFSHTDLKSELPDLPYHIALSSCSAIFGILGQVFFNISLTCEDPTKVSIAKTSDVFFSYILQLFILNISVDFLSIIGSISILFGTFIVLSFKILENKLKKSPKSSCFKKVLLFSF